MSEKQLLVEQVCGLLQGEARRQRERASLEVPGFGRAGLPFEFWPLIPIPSEVRVVEANTPPSAVLQAIRSDAVVVLTGDFTRAAGILKYMDRMGKGVLDRSVFRNIPNRFDRSRREQAGVRGALYRLTMVVRDGRLRGVTGGPFSPGRDLRPWIEGGEDTPAGSSLLIPLRKILRMASDIKRLEEGVFVPSLGASLVVLPTVFAPVDQKVVSLFDEHVEIAAGDRALDVGTGTGVLALIAARRGAEVAATDRNPEAVSCARLNARRLGLLVEVLGPCDLFDGVRGRRFRHILFNAPWLAGSPRTAYEAALYDDGGVIGRFFEGVCDHLAPEGTVWLLYGDVFERTGDGALTRVKDLLRSRGLTVQRQWRTVRAGRVSGRRETVVLYEIKISPQRTQSPSPPLVPGAK